MNSRKAEQVLEALRAAQTEIEAMEDSYEDYVAAGHLIEQIEDAVHLMEEELANG
jgi:hypothetical protein